MFHPRVTQPRVLFMGLCLVIVAHTHSVTTQRTSQPVANNDTNERQLQVFELDVKAEQLKEELRNLKETVLDEIQDRKTEALNETRLSTEEATQSLQDIKSEILTELRRQDERRRQEMVEFDMKAGQLKDELRILKETVLDEIQDRKAEVLSEIKQSIKEATQTLQDITSAALSEKQMKSKQQDTGRKTYRKYDDGVTHRQAIRACEQRGGRLALPTNDEENKLIWREIGVEHYDPRWSWRKFYWISGTDQYEEGNWVDSITGQPLRYTHFAKGEPNNWGGNEDCIHMYNSPKWYDNNCNSIGLGYVCEFVN